jgi:hypothetical protein
MDDLIRKDDGLLPLGRGWYRRSGMVAICINCNLTSPFMLGSHDAVRVCVMELGSSGVSKDEDANKARPNANEHFS